MAIQVVVTIPPLAGMIQPYLTEQDQLVVLLEPGVSPHGFQFRPSHLVALQNADLILTVGNSVDSWIEKPLQQRLAQASGAALKVVRMQKQPGLVVYPRFQTQKLDVHASQAEHENEPEHEHEHEHEHDHDSTGYDPHIWLSITNARLMLSAISTQLQALQPKSASRFSELTQQLQTDYQRLDQQIDQLMAPLRHQSYLVMHDAYQYFERAYGLQNQGIVQLSDELTPSVKHLLSLRKTIQTLGIQCVFKEPQFSDRQLTSITQGLTIQIGTLDPLGHDLKDYRQLMRQLAQNVATCLEAGQ